MGSRAWLVPLAAAGGYLLYRSVSRGSLRRSAENIRAFDLPSAWLYDLLFASLLGRFYSTVADEVTAPPTSGSLLEVGSGGGQLAVEVARKAPGLTITGVDISSEMVERAKGRAAAAGVDRRVHFDVGDVGVLPFPDRHFDKVVSTLSLHHWPDPPRGLAEIYRVLKPGGEAWVYDISGWFWRVVHGGQRLEGLAAASPFQEVDIVTFRWLARVPALSRMRLRRKE